MTIALNQDYPTTGALSVSEVDAPETYTLYVFQYSDWIIGNQASPYAVGQSGLNHDGSWISVVYVASGTYTVVVRNQQSMVEIAPHLEVT